MNLEIINYTTNEVHSFDDSTDLETFYSEANEAHEIGISHSSIGYIPNERDEALDLLNLSDEEHDQIKAIGSIHGDNYFTSIHDHLKAFEELVILATVDEATTLHQTAHELNYSVYLQDELNSILGCSQEAYEQLGRFISDDDIAYILDTEYYLIHLSNRTLIVVQ